MGRSKDSTLSFLNALAPDPLLIRLVVQACDERERKRSDGGGDADHDESKKPESKLRRAL